jgi:hypothetical protein
MPTGRWMCPFVLITLFAGSAQSEELLKTIDDRQLVQVTDNSGTQSSASRPNEASTTLVQPATRLEEVTVTRRRPTQTASSETIRARDFELRPHSTTQEILNNLPGLVAG